MDRRLRGSWAFCWNVGSDRRSSIESASLSPESPASSLPRAIEGLRTWIEARQFAGYEPFDLLNSPYLRGSWARQTLPGVLFIQLGKRFAGARLRRLLRVPLSRNPKALGLCLSAYCDLARSGYDVAAQTNWLKGELRRLRSPGESDYCWGYDWDYLSLRGSRLPAFSANAIASYFCATALMEMNEVFGDVEAGGMAASTAHFFASRLHRSFEADGALCFSYTPDSNTLIYNSSALVGVLLARVGKLRGHPEYQSLARKTMGFVERCQLSTGGWYYGQMRRQHWIDSFHTSYNVCALLAYQQLTGDRSFEPAMLRGHRYYQANFFTVAGAPKYFHNRTFPIDIHACSQAILHFVNFAAIDPDSQGRADQIFGWTMNHMAAADGSFYYQRHRLWINRTPYMRWGQAWMFHALARLLASTAAFPHLPANAR